MRGVFLYGPRLPLLLYEAAQDLEQKSFLVRLICDGRLLNSFPQKAHITFIVSLLWHIFRVLSSAVLIEIQVVGAGGFEPP